MKLGSTPWSAARNGPAVLTAVIALLSSGASADIITGLQGKYDFDSPLTVGDDGSGNANHGTLSGQNAAWFNDPVRGGVLSMTGAQNNPGFILIPDSPSLSIIGDLTIAAFVNVNSYATFNSIVGKTTGNQPSSYDLYLVSGSGLPRLFRGNGSTTSAKADASGPVPAQQWHFMTATMSGTTVNHYLDGVPFGSGTITVPMGDGEGPLYIGSRADQFTAFNGSMDAVRIYNRALSPADVAELYAANVPEPGVFGLSGLAIAGTLLRRRRHT